MLEERERYWEEMLHFRNVKKHELRFSMKNLPLFVPLVYLHVT
jgi:hypothetical protein